MSGVYGIEHFSTGKIYIGSTARSIRTRLSEHRNTLNRGVHPNPHLQAAWVRYGETAFRFVTLEQAPEDIIAAEQAWIDYYLANESGCYNLRVKAESNIGIKMPPRTDDHRRNLGESIRARNGTPEGKQTLERQRLSGWQRMNTPAAIAKRAAGHRGVSPSRDLVQRRADSRSRTWTGFVSPNGIVYRDIHNLAAFCRDHDLIISHMHKVHCGKRNQHRGWTAVREINYATSD